MIKPVVPSPPKKKKRAVPASVTERRGENNGGRGSPNAKARTVATKTLQAGEVTRPLGRLASSIASTSSMVGRQAAGQCDV